MGLLNDTLIDAMRPLPESGSRLRRSADPNIEAAPEAMEDAMDESGALTIYRLQKDGSSGLPAVPSDLRAGDAGMQLHDPLSAPAVNSREHDASPRVDIWKSGLETGERQESVTRSEAKDRQERFAAAVSTFPSDDAESFMSRSESGRTPDVNESASNLVERNEGESNARRVTGRGTPSGEPHLPPPAEQPMREVAIADTGRHHDKGGTPQAGETVGNTPMASAMRSGGEGLLADSLNSKASPENVAGRSPQPAGYPGFEEAGFLPAAPLPIADAVSVAGVTARHRIPPVDASSQQAPIGTPEYHPVSDAGPRLQIGRIDVLVVADEKPKARSNPSRDDGFLSRNYLRRL